MRFIADFHIHSKYSRATSKEMNLESLDKWAKIKGIDVLGTGDFTHPAWFKELKEKLEPAEAGLYKLKGKYAKEFQKSGGDWFDSKKQMRFILTVEISQIYSKGGKVRRIHNLIFAPSLEIAGEINRRLGMIGNLKSDGRPILGLDSETLAQTIFSINPNIAIIPAHCLLPDTIIHTKDNLLQPIKEIKKSDFVITHQNRWRKVKEIFKRPYKGKIYHIKPRNFSLGLTTTSEHPFYAIKTQKNCCWNNGICKPSHLSLRRCKHKYFKNYKPEWIIANRLERGDILIYPRFKNIFGNLKKNYLIDLKDAVNKSAIKADIDDEYIAPIGNKITAIKRKIVINKNFCKLAGYYLAEGYTNSRDLIGFAFHYDERKYADEVIDLMKKVFGFNKEPKLKINKSKGIEILFYSKILCELFQQFFYLPKSKIKNAGTKALPGWALKLSLNLQAEIFRCWWRGDGGYTVSRLLMNQMKIILLRLGIVPSIYVDTKGRYNSHLRHYIGKRKINARYDIYSLSRLSFYEDKFNLLKEPEFAKVAKYNKGKKYGWIDDNYIYLPIYDIEIKNYNGDVYNLEVEEDNSYTCEFATIHNCWTPWFSIFGSMSGFDTIEECFGNYAKNIFALETGLSSDPAMNWRLSALDNIALISNSDSHSAQKIGREANVFDAEMNYFSILEAIKSKDPAKFLFTVEFFPEEGKYHYDGHRACGVSLKPEETKKYKNICPKCGRSLTVGVLNRVNQLADRPEGQKPERAIPFKNLIPLDEIIAEALDLGAKTKAVVANYQKLIAAFGTEFNVLLNAPIEEIKKAAPAEIAEGIKRTREGKISILPGYDGEYGKIKIFTEKERKDLAEQKTLWS